MVCTGGIVRFSRACARRPKWPKLAPIYITGAGAQRKYREALRPISIASLLKPVSRLERAAVDPGLVGIDSGVATCPTEKQGWPQGENNGLAVDFGLNVYALGSGGQGEVQAF